MSDNINLKTALSIYCPELSEYDIDFFSRQNHHRLKSSKWCFTKPLNTDYCLHIISLPYVELMVDWSDDTHRYYRISDEKINEILTYENILKNI